MTDRFESVEGAAIGRYPQPAFLRWVYVVSAVLWLGLGVVQLIRGTWPWALLLAATWGVAAVEVWRRAVLVVTDQGFRSKGRRMVPWAEVSEVVVPPADGWKHQAELVLRDGSRRILPELDARQLESLRFLVGRDVPPAR